MMPPPYTPPQDAIEALRDDEYYAKLVRRGVAGERQCNCEDCDCRRDSQEVEVVKHTIVEGERNSNE